MARADDPYAVLGVPHDASPEDIKRAFRKLAKELHPDVAGHSPEKLARFNAVRHAYETLSDPDRRRQHDRRRAPDPGFGRAPPPGSPRGRPTAQGVDLDLEDIFGDFGRADDFGFGRAASPGRRPLRPQPGRDVHVSVDVAASLVAGGGTVSVAYQRLKRIDGGEVLGRFDEVQLLRVPPGVRTGDELRVAKLGDFGLHGGPPGDLVATVRVVGGEPRPAAPETDPAVVVVDIGVGEAVLGGQVRVPTPTGAVRVTVPPGTSSGTRLRVRGRAAGGADLFAEVRIVVPRTLDDESRRLIERFAQLNPRVEEA